MGACREVVAKHGYTKGETKGEDFHRRYWAGGFRYLMLEDQLAVNLSSSVSTGATSFDTYTASDSFRTLNQFYGGEFGMIEKWWRDRWSLQVLGKVALGATTVSTRINGVTTETATTSAGTTTTGTYPGGVLAQPTNPSVATDDSSLTTDEFVGCKIQHLEATDSAHTSATVGYTCDRSSRTGMTRYSTFRSVISGSSRNRRIRRLYPTTRRLQPTNQSLVKTLS